MDSPPPAPCAEPRGRAGAGQHVLVERATVEDADAIRLMVAAAYSKYVERIGREPAPMRADYHALIAGHTQDVYVLRSSRDEGGAVGSILLSDCEGDDSVQVDNLVVHPEAQGRGYGRLLMAFAEDYARARGRAALTLYTNEKMHENLVLYQRMGFVQVDNRVEDGYRRVYFRRQLVLPAASRDA